MTEMGRTIIILGAARSGTKMIRSVVASHHRVVAVPHDINFVWKIGNYRVPHDELRPEDARPGTVAHIRRFFESFRAGDPSTWVAEKTVSNTLRVGFVERVLPGAKYIHIIRNGLDVAASSEKKWRGPLEVKRVLEKMKLFPLRALPQYGLRYAQSYLKRILGAERRVGSWGPRFRGIDEALRRLPLLAVCGLQWRLCVEKCRRQLSEIPAGRRLEIRYEGLTANPSAEVERIREFLGLEPSADMREFSRYGIRSSSVGKWKRSLHTSDVELLRPHIGGLMLELGYDMPPTVGGGAGNA